MFNAIDLSNIDRIKLSLRASAFVMRIFDRVYLRDFR